MKNIILQVFLILISVNIYTEDLNLKEIEKADIIKNQTAMIDKLKEIKGMMKNNNLQKNIIEEYKTTYKEFDISSLIFPDNKFEKKVEIEKNGEEIFQLGCNGITYKGQIEQIGISYLELARDVFKKYTDPYVCKPEDSCTSNPDKCDLEDYATGYAITYCTVDLAKYMTTGTDTNGNKISGLSMADLSAVCTGELMDGQKVEAGLTKANAGLVEAGGHVKMGFSGFYKYSKCILDGLNELGLVKYFDTCMDKNKNDFLDFVFSLMNTDIGIDMGIQKLRIQKCKFELDSNGNTLKLKGGLFDLFQINKETGFKGSYKNINGLLLNSKTKEVKIVDDVFHYEFKQKQKLPTKISTKTISKIEKILNSKIPKIKTGYFRNKDNYQCLYDSYKLLNNKIALFYSLPNLGIDEIILDKVEKDLNQGEDFIKNYKNELLAQSCYKVKPKVKKIVLKRLKKYNKNILLNYFTKIREILKEYYNNGTLFDEEYFFNRDLGELNKQVLFFTIKRITKREELFLKTEILNKIYNKYKYNWK